MRKTQPQECHRTLPCEGGICETELMVRRLQASPAASFVRSRAAGSDVKRCSLCTGAPGNFYACAGCRKKAAFAMTDGREAAASAA